MNRTELAHVIATVIHQHRLDGFTSRELAFAILDKAEPLIRADERVGMGPLWRGGAAEVEAVTRAAVRADLRAKVEALDGDSGGGTAVAWIRRADVLALLGGPSDD